MFFTVTFVSWCDSALDGEAARLRAGHDADTASKKKRNDKMVADTQTEQMQLTGQLDIMMVMVIMMIYMLVC